MIKFTVWGSPVAQGRPRFARQGNFVRTYDPEKSRSYKQLVYLEACKVKPDVPLEGPLSVSVSAYLPIPKSWPKKKREAAIKCDLLPTNKMDCDNIAKGCLDSLNGLIYVDDGQITDLKIKKKYSEEPRIEVSICPIR